MSSIPARMKKIQLKMKALECSQDFSHYKSIGTFPDAQGQLTPQSLVRSCRISNSSEMLSMSSLPVSMKKIRSKMKAIEWSQHFPHYGSYPLPWTPEFRSDLAQNLMQPFPHPNNGPAKILLRLTHWLQRYSSLKMSTDTQTDTQTDDGSTGILKAHLEPSAQVS